MDKRFYFTLLLFFTFSIGLHASVGSDSREYDQSLSSSETNNDEKTNCIENLVGGLANSDFGSLDEVMCRKENGKDNFCGCIDDKTANSKKDQQERKKREELVEKAIKDSLRTQSYMSLFKSIDSSKDYYSSLGKSISGESFNCLESKVNPKVKANKEELSKSMASINLIISNFGIEGMSRKEIQEKFRSGTLDDEFKKMKNQSINMRDQRFFVSLVNDKMIKTESLILNLIPKDEDRLILGDSKIEDRMPTYILNHIQSECNNLEKILSDKELREKEVSNLSEGFFNYLFLKGSDPEQESIRKNKLNQMKERFIASYLKLTQADTQKSKIRDKTEEFFYNMDLLFCTINPKIRPGKEKEFELYEKNKRLMARLANEKDRLGNDLGGIEVSAQAKLDLRMLILFSMKGGQFDLSNLKSKDELVKLIDLKATDDGRYYLDKTLVPKIKSLLNSDDEASATLKQLMNNAKGKDYQIVNALNADELSILERRQSVEEGASTMFYDLFNSTPSIDDSKYASYIKSDEVQSVITQNSTPSVKRVEFDNLTSDMNDLNQKVSETFLEKESQRIVNERELTPEKIVNYNSLGTQFNKKPTTMAQTQNMVQSHKMIQSKSKKIGKTPLKVASASEYEQVETPKWQNKKTNQSVASKSTKELDPLAAERAKFEQEKLDFERRKFEADKAEFERKRQEELAQTEDTPAQEVSPSNTSSTSTPAAGGFITADSGSSNDDNLAPTNNVNNVAANNVANVASTSDSSVNSDSGVAKGSANRSKGYSSGSKSSSPGIVLNSVGTGEFSDSFDYEVVNEDKKGEEKKDFSSLIVHLKYNILELEESEREEKIQELTSANQTDELLLVLPGGKKVKVKKKQDKKRASSSGIITALKDTLGSKKAVHGVTDTDSTNQVGSGRRE